MKKRIETLDDFIINEAMKTVDYKEQLRKFSELKADDMIIYVGNDTLDFESDQEYKIKSVKPDKFRPSIVIETRDGRKTMIVDDPMDVRIYEK